MANLFTAAVLGETITNSLWLVTSDGKTKLLLRLSAITSDVDVCRSSRDRNADGRGAWPDRNGPIHFFRA